ncbi:MAG: hypothetical protein K6A67_00705 [Bacteroidales bacterium]|nr:hypothetical protein [Bacteroidales bacterium]
MSIPKVQHHSGRIAIVIDWHLDTFYHTCVAVVVALNDRHGSVSSTIRGASAAIECDTDCLASHLLLFHPLLQLLTVSGGDGGTLLGSR